MRIIKKINNNVAIGVDSNGREIIITGRGVGFNKMPYELNDLSKIDRTFYNIESKYYGLLKEIPEEIFMMVSGLLDQVKGHIEEELNPSLVFVLADHINFAIIRYHQGINVGLTYSFEMEYEYPKLIKLATWFVEQINKQMNIELDKGEITSVTVHFLNAMNRKENRDTLADVNFRVEEIVDAIITIIENHFDTKVNKSSFSYFQFKNHIKYFAQRKKKINEFDNNNVELYQNLREKYPDVGACVDKMDAYLEDKTGEKCTEEELMYLMIHVFKLHNKNIGNGIVSLDK